MKVMKVLVLIAVLSFILATPIFAVTVAEITDVRTGDFEVVGFTLKKGAEVDIDAVGIRSPHSRDMLAYAWIINSDTRKIVWEMESRRSDRINGNYHLRQHNEVEYFEPGRYELYYTAVSTENWQWKSGSSDFFESLGRIFDDKDSDGKISRRDLRQCYVKLNSGDLTESDIEKFEPDGGMPGALIKHTRLGNDEYIKTGFELTQPGNLHIYAIFEQPNSYDGEPVDYAWIVNLDNREKVWEPGRWDIDYAGGGEKNQKYDEDVKFEKGRYVLYVVSDDSHSFDDFNVNPPYDPYNWGVTILPGKNFDKSSFKLVDVPGRGDALIDFTRARNNDMYEQAFKLDKETRLRIYAIGEMGWSDHEFADYGTIINTTTGRPVWEMTDRNTQHAGGAKKNRMFDGYVTFPAGTYTAYYYTDDSHAFRNWNSSAPFDAEAYGMAIYPDGNAKPAGFKLLDENEINEGTNILARITRVGDGERRRARFELKKESKVSIYALGEGSGGDMYDYAYIVDMRTGRDIWEMRYRRTDHAGGADKNRMVKDEITLEPGEYEVVYESDGSHSFRRWNASPPRDPMNWGVTVSVVP